MKLRNPEALQAFVGRGEGRIMTCAELSREAEVNRSTIDHLLSGRRKTVKKEIGRMIEQALGVPPHVIFVENRW